MLRDLATISNDVRRFNHIDRHSLSLTCAKPSNEIFEAQESERARAKIQPIALLDTLNFILFPPLLFPP